MAILHFPIILPFLDKSTLFQVHIRKSKKMSPKDDVTMETLMDGYVTLGDVK